MWIRSQDERELLDTREFKILDTTIFGFSHLQEKGYEKLGAYKTRARAIEVLSEIECKIFNCTEFTKIDRTKEASTGVISKITWQPVYRMPQE